MTYKRYKNIIGILIASPFSYADVHQKNFALIYPHQVQQAKLDDSSDSAKPAAVKGVGSFFCY